MKHLFYIIALFAAISCVSIRPDIPEPKVQEKVTYTLTAQKTSWSPMTKSSVSDNDIPWKEGDSVVLIESSQSRENLKWSKEWINEYGTLCGTSGIYKPNVTICAVMNVDGMSCSLLPPKELPSGTYRAFYPKYDIIWYDYVHLCFIYNKLDKDEYPENILVSDPVDYEPGDTVNFVMNHLCALMNIDIAAPRSGKYKHLKLFADEVVFAAKVNIYLDEEYDINKFSQGWINFTSLQNQGKDTMSIPNLGYYHTSTAILPAPFDDIPVRVYLIYDDGDCYVSDPFTLPTLNVGNEINITVDNFQEVVYNKEDGLPIHGFISNNFRDPSPRDYTITN